MTAYIDKGASPRVGTPASEYIRHMTERHAKLFNDTDDSKGSPWRRLRERAAASTKQQANEAGSDDG